MNQLLEAFALFVQDCPQFNKSDSIKVADFLGLLMDPDPQRAVMKEALEHYANRFNWPYQIQTPDGIQVSGMDVLEATEIAQQALRTSDVIKREIMHVLIDEGGATDMWHTQLIMPIRVS